MNTALIINIVIAVVFVAVGFFVAIARNKYQELQQLRAQGLKAAPKAATDDDGEPSTGQESFWFGLGYSGIAALTAILIPLGLWFGLQVGRKWFGEEQSLTSASVVLTLVVIAGVISLLAVLMMTALAFSAVKLSDNKQALGLPEGSVRAVIALSLIVIFVITVVFLFGGLNRPLGRIEHITFEQANAVPVSVLVSKRAEDPAVAELLKKAEEAKAKNDPNAATLQKDAETAAKASLYTVERSVDPSRGSEDFAKQIITTLSTLVVSISAFYFGSSTAISAQKSGQKTAAAAPTATPSAPVITKDPANLDVKADEPAEFTVTATGSDLTYQWQSQKVTADAATDIPGATTNTYRIAKVTTDDSGTKFSCKITNPAGTVTSKVATLTVT
jgi:hypothetical protein